MVKREYVENGPITIWGAFGLNILILLGFGAKWLYDYKIQIPVSNTSKPQNLLK